MTGGFDSLRGEMTAGFSSMRKEMDARFDALEPDDPAGRRRPDRDRTRRLMGLIATQL
jgi:hypothetical protein